MLSAYKMVVVFDAVAGLSAELRSEFDEVVLLSGDSVFYIPGFGSVYYPRCHVHNARLDHPRGNEVSEGEHGQAQRDDERPPGTVCAHDRADVYEPRGGWEEYHQCGGHHHALGVAALPL